MVQFNAPPCDAAPEAEMLRLADGVEKIFLKFADRTDGWDSQR